MANKQSTFNGWPAGNPLQQVPHSYTHMLLPWKTNVSKKCIVFLQPALRCIKYSIWSQIIFSQDETIYSTSSKTKTNKTKQQLWKELLRKPKAPELLIFATDIGGNGACKRRWLNFSDVMVLEELRGLTFLSMDSPKPQRVDKNSMGWMIYPPPQTPKCQHEKWLLAKLKV